MARTAKDIGAQAAEQNRNAALGWFGGQSLRVIQLEEAIGRPPELKEFGRPAFEWRSAILAEDPLEAWQRFLAAIHAELAYSPRLSGSSAIRWSRRHGLTSRRPADGLRGRLAEQIAARIQAARAEQQAGTNPPGLMFPSPRGTWWRSSNFDRRVLAPAYRSPHPTCCRPRTTAAQPLIPRNAEEPFAISLVSAIVGAAILSPCRARGRFLCTSLD